MLLVVHWNKQKASCLDLRKFLGYTHKSIFHARRPLEEGSASALSKERKLDIDLKGKAVHLSAKACIVIGLGLLQAHTWWLKTSIGFRDGRGRGLRGRVSKQPDIYREDKAFWELSYQITERKQHSGIT